MVNVDAILARDKRIRAEERERCAKIADDYAAEFGDERDPLALHSREIARLIRAV